MGFSLEFEDGSKLLVPSLKVQYDLTKPGGWTDGWELRDGGSGTMNIRVQTSGSISSDYNIFSNCFHAAELMDMLKSDSSLFTYADKNEKTQWEDYSSERHPEYNRIQRKEISLKNGSKMIFFKAYPRAGVNDYGHLSGFSETAFSWKMGQNQSEFGGKDLRGENAHNTSSSIRNYLPEDVPVYPSYPGQCSLNVILVNRLIELIDINDNHYLAEFTVYLLISQRATESGFKTVRQYQTFIAFEKDQTNPRPDYYPTMAFVENSTGENPFDPSTPGGGGGTGDTGTDPVPKPSIPTGGAIGTIVNAYYITNEQLRDLNDYLWSDDFIENIKKIQNDPMEAVITINSYNIPIAYGTLTRVIMGNTTSTSSAYKLDQQYYTIDCGSIYVPEFFGNALDYSPYTRVEIALPYIGIKPLSIDDVMAKNVGVTYHVDILTGGCIAFITCDDVVMYTYGGTCSTGLPITASDKAEKMKALIQSVSTAGIGLAMGGGMGAAAGAASGAINTLLTKNHVEHGGSIGGDVGIMGIKTPYLILQRPIQSIAASFNSEKGFPSNITATLGSLTGYTEVDSIKLAISTATDNELSEIEQLLREGIIL